MANTGTPGRPRPWTRGARQAAPAIDPCRIRGALVASSSALRSIEWSVFNRKRFWRFRRPGPHLARLGSVRRNGGWFLCAWWHVRLHMPHPPPLQSARGAPNQLVRVACLGDGDAALVPTRLLAHALPRSVVAYTFRHSHIASRSARSRSAASGWGGLMRMSRGLWVTRSSPSQARRETVCPAVACSAGR